MLHEAIEKAGYTPGKEIAIAFDAAASHFYDHDSGNYNFEGTVKTPDEMGDYYVKLLSEFPEIISIEDPYGEDDWDNFAKFAKKKLAIKYRL